MPTACKKVSELFSPPTGWCKVPALTPLWATFKPRFTRAVILGVMLALPLLGLVGIVFASITLIFNALAKGYDFFTSYFSLFLTPTMFLSGVFFPRDQLPGVMRVMSDWAAADRRRRTDSSAVSGPVAGAGIACIWSCRP